MSALEIGNGFVSCTRQSEVFDFPTEQPLIRFLDTRGLGEVGYEPAEDLALCSGRSHALLVVARIDDPVQGEIADALRKIVKERPTTPIGVVHTGTDLLADTQEARRAIASNQRSFEQATGRELPSAEAALGDVPDIDEVLDLLAGWLPLVAFSRLADERRDAESNEFRKIQPLILKYCTAAAAVDVAPAVGFVGVPALQGAMLRGIARHYGASWTRRMALNFGGTLGASTMLRFGASFGVRQAAKLVPGWGQTIGAASAAAISFSATFALGRAAAYYLFKKRQGEELSHDELQAVFDKALRGARHEPVGKD